MSTVIIGAGIIGVSTAYYLSKSDPSNADQVYLVEASPDLFASASGFAGGFLAEDWFSPSLSNLGKLSFRLHKELAQAHNGHELWGYSQSTGTSLAEETVESNGGSGADWLREGASRAEAAKNTDPNSSHAPQWLKSKGEFDVLSSGETTAQWYVIQILRNALEFLHFPARLLSSLQNHVQHSASAFPKQFYHPLKDQYSFEVLQNQCHEVTKAGPINRTGSTSLTPCPSKQPSPSLRLPPLVLPFLRRSTPSTCSPHWHQSPLVLFRRISHLCPPDTQYRNRYHREYTVRPPSHCYRRLVLPSPLHPVSRIKVQTACHFTRRPLISTPNPALATKTPGSNRSRGTWSRGLHNHHHERAREDGRQTPLPCRLHHRSRFRHRRSLQSRTILPNAEWGSLPRRPQLRYLPLTARSQRAPHR